MSTFINNYSNYKNWIEALPFLLIKTEGNSTENTTPQTINTLALEAFSKKIEVEGIAPSILQILTSLNTQDIEILEKSQKIYQATHGFSNTSLSETTETTVTSETIIKSFLQDPQVVKAMRVDPELCKTVIPSDELVYISFGNDQPPLLFFKSFLEAKAPYLHHLLNSGLKEIVTTKDMNGRVESRILQLDRTPVFEYMVKQMESEIETGFQNPKVTQEFIDSYKVEDKLNTRDFINDCFQFQCSDVIVDQFSKHLLYNDNSPINEEFISELSLEFELEKIIRERCEALALADSFRKLDLLIKKGDKPTDWEMLNTSDADIERLETVLSRLEKIRFDFGIIDLSIHIANSQFETFPPSIAKYVTTLRLQNFQRLTNLSLPKVKTLEMWVSDSLTSIEVPKVQTLEIKYITNLMSLNLPEALNLSVAGGLISSIDAPKAKDVDLWDVKLTSSNFPEDVTLKIDGQEVSLPLMHQSP